MGIYEDQLLPRIINLVLGGKQPRDIRRRATSGLSGDVLEVGFGSGLNVPLYPAGVSKVIAVDPATAGRKIAAKRVAASPVPVDYIGLDGQSLPLESDSVDNVLVTWTLCTIPDVDAALREMLRVLRPGGALRFAEHGRSPDPEVARRQDRFTPIQRRIAGGCHLNRPIDTLIKGAGFKVTQLDNFFMPGPKAFGYMYVGTATAA